MKCIFNSSIIAVVFLFAGCSKATTEKPAAVPEKSEPEKKVGVTLDVETQARLGLKMALPVATQWQPELKAYGQVLDSAPLLEALMELGRAEMTFDSSHQELERAKKMKADNNLSERAFQEAEAMYKQNFAAVTAAQLKLQNGWGRKISEMMGSVVVPPGTERMPDDFLKRYPENVALVRVDLPVGERWNSDMRSARLVTLVEKTSPEMADYFDVLPTMDAQAQQQAVLFSVVQNATNRLVSGEALTAFIKTSGEAISGVVIPASAVLRYEGKGWVYVQMETNQFVRAEIPLDCLTENGWFVLGNISTTNQVVVSGAQAVLSAELNSGATGESHD